MRIKKVKTAGAFTLVEVMVTILILSVALIGASGYRYYAALDARKASLQATAARIALLFCESWRGVKGAQTYDPVTHLGAELTIEQLFGAAAGATEDDFDILGGFRVTTNDASYNVTLGYKDLGVDLRAINVTVGWTPQGLPVEDLADPGVKLFKLTTYTEL